MGNKSSRGHKPERRVASLRALLVTTTTAQVVLTGLLVAVVSFGGADRVVRALVQRVQQEISENVEEHLASYLATPYQVNALNADAIAAGLLPLDDPEVLQQHFLEQLKVFPPASFIELGRWDGSFVGVERAGDGTYWVELTDPDGSGKSVYALDASGRRFPEPIEEVEGYDATSRPWYQAALASGEPSWSPVYQFSSTSSVRLGLTAVQPLFDETGAIVAVLGTDVELAHLGTFLRSLDAGPGGLVLVVERDGRIVASSALETPFTVSEQGEAARILVSQAPLARTRATAKVLQDELGGLSEIRDRTRLRPVIDKERCFLQVVPFSDGRGIDWLIITVLPEADYLGGVQATTRAALVLCALALLLSVAAAFYVSRRISQPVARLAEAAEALSKGKYNQPVPAWRTLEIGQLAEALMHMQFELQNSFRQLQAYSSELERNIEQHGNDFRALQREQESALERSRSQALFLERLGIELRAALEAIVSYTEQGQREPASSEEELGRVRTRAVEVLGLIGMVLDLLRFDAGNLDLRLAEFDVGALVDEVAGALRAELEGKATRLEVRREGPLDLALSDRAKIARALRYVLTNAVASAPGGTVTLEARREMDADEIEWLLFRVGDSGPVPDDLERVLEPFAIEGDGSNRTRGRTGLGLVVARRYCEALAGRLTVSRDEAGAISFLLRLPAFCSIEASGAVTIVASGGTLS